MAASTTTPSFRLEYDWCVASVHSHFDLTADQQTQRLLKAMADPAVNAIGHLTGRYIGRRPGIELNLDAVLEGLAISGVALEVNGALDRLDASADVIRRAVAAGVKLVISTDSHHTSDLKRMAYGVSHAQRGWAAAGGCRQHHASDRIPRFRREPAIRQCSIAAQVLRAAPGCRRPGRAKNAGAESVR